MFYSEQPETIEPDSPISKPTGQIRHKATPLITGAGIFCIIAGLTLGIAGAGNTHSSSARTPDIFDTTQSTRILAASNAYTGMNAVGGPQDYWFIDEEASVLVAQDGPSQSVVSYENEFKRGSIATYVVEEGDTLSAIALKHNVSVNTIRWQNDLDEDGTIKLGQTLIILPVDGVRHVVKEGDTLSSIASAYSGDVDEIVEFNDLDDVLRVGAEIIVPGGEPKQAPAPRPAKPSAQPARSSSRIASSYYVGPLKGRGILSQSYHGRWRAIDIAVPVGTPVYASAGGRVVIANNSGWGGGYGTYLIIEHNNGSKTLYAHHSKNIAKLGQYVSQGDMIAYSGNTGRSTGPHLHFEIRSGIDVPCSLFGYGSCR